MGETAARLNCRVVTPDSTALDQDADSVIVPAFDGQLGVLNNHAPMVALVGLGELKVRTGKETLHLAVDGGFLQIKDNRVTILTTRAASAADLDPEELAAQAASLGETGPADLDERARWEKNVAWNKLCRRLAAEAVSG